MTVIRPGKSVHLVADKLLTHAKPHYQNGLSGVVQKQDNPHAFDALSTRTQVQAGVTYALIVKGETEQAALAGAAVGQAVYIHPADDSLVLTPAAGVDKPFGRVSNLPSTFGLPATTMRIDMDLKDTIPVP